MDYSTSLGTNTNFPLDSGDPFANALLGVFTSYTQASQKVATNSVYNTVEGYIQDTWRVTPTLTLDYGLRFSYLGPVHDLSQQEEYFEPSLWNPAQAVRLYTPVSVNGTERVVDPGNIPTNLTIADTLPTNYLGLIVPGSGNPTNGLVSGQELSITRRLHAGRPRGARVSASRGSRSRNGRTRRFRHLLRPRPNRL